LTGERPTTAFLACRDYEDFANGFA
jgi:hypothetical protein